ncbi:hypothetical protein M1N05_01695 [Dehalococcoidales bacterium]|nr:hypothetical protein [Dehalococcoidales bacterium]
MDRSRCSDGLGKGGREWRAWRDQFGGGLRVRHSPLPHLRLGEDGCPLATVTIYLLTEELSATFALLAANPRNLLPYPGH